MRYREEIRVQRNRCAKKEKIKKKERRKDRKKEGKKIRRREKIQVQRNRRAKKEKKERKKKRFPKKKCLERRCEEKEVWGGEGNPRDRCKNSGSGVQ